MNRKYDLVCVGGGIMSATLANICHLLNPELEILVLERLDAVAQESSASWNNAGTGHSALCELNYTPENEDGSINMSKAIKICQQFEISKEFWSYLVDKGLITDPSAFLNSVPHHSFVTGKKNVKYLTKRYEAMKDHFMFEDIQFTTDLNKMTEWFPLIMKGRKEGDDFAATRIERGTEVNFGELTTQLFEILQKSENTEVRLNHDVLDIDPDDDHDWVLNVENLKTGEKGWISAEHIFIGGGGASLNLLEKVEIHEKDGYGGFPISGQWLVCKNPEIIEQHFAKVYSMAEVGSPPMSIPHLDTRIINGKRELLFGPFAGLTTKFLKSGSKFDLFQSLNFQNLHSMWGVFWHNLHLTKYLYQQAMMSFDDRMDELRKFVLDAKNEDWEILVAGQRVQTIKKDEEDGGKLEFGTELVSSSDGKITCLLGASPGASTAVIAMMGVVEKAFPEYLEDPAKRAILEEILPSYGKKVEEEHFRANLARSKKSLNLKY
ncbi:MAG: malate dehydrogenase (quinone) [Flavobacteriales bacterium]|nr:malate dehydrogenase (quinone) [Flavobacteriales bacterium]MCB9198683.1 malate dehydrogenase (quinone) [Flavobacteriales bacterium]